MNFERFNSWRLTYTPGIVRLWESLRQSRRFTLINYGLVMVGIAASSIIFGKLSMIINANDIETGDFTSSLILAATLCAVPIIMMVLLKRRVKGFGKNI